LNIIFKGGILTLAGVQIHPK